MMWKKIRYVTFTGPDVHWGWAVLVWGIGIIIGSAAGVYWGLHP